MINLSINCFPNRKVLLFIKVLTVGLEGNKWIFMPILPYLFVVFGKSCVTVRELQSVYENRVYCLLHSTETVWVTQTSGCVPRHTQSTAGRERTANKGRQIEISFLDSLLNLKSLWNCRSSKRCTTVCKITNVICSGVAYLLKGLDRSILNFHKSRNDYTISYISI